jgi:hypothetical protein
VGFPESQGGPKPWSSRDVARLGPAHGLQPCTSLALCGDRSGYSGLHKDTIYRCLTTIRYMICEVSIIWGAIVQLSSRLAQLPHYAVIGAAELPLTRLKNLPNSFVQVSGPGFRYETKVVKRSQDPNWNEVTRL